MLTNTDQNQPMLHQALALLIVAELASRAISVLQEVQALLLCLVEM